MRSVKPCHAYLAGDAWIDSRDDLVIDSVCLDESTLVLAQSVLSRDLRALRPSQVLALLKASCAELGDCFPDVVDGVFDGGGCQGDKVLTWLLITGLELRLNH